MTKERKALELALEVLKNQFDSDSWKIALATQIIEGALAQPEQAKPVGQLLEDTFGRGQVMWFNKPADESMLYTHPPIALAQTELIDDMIEALKQSQNHLQFAQDCNYVTVFDHRSIDETLDYIKAALAKGGGK